MTHVHYQCQLEIIKPNRQYRGSVALWDSGRPRRILYFLLEVSCQAQKKTITFFTDPTHNTFFEHGEGVPGKKTKDVVKGSVLLFEFEFRNSDPIKRVLFTVVLRAVQATLACNRDVVRDIRVCQASSGKIRLVQEGLEKITMNSSDTWCLSQVLTRPLSDFIY